MTEMITALSSRPVDLLLAVGLPRSPQLPRAFISSLSSTTGAAGKITAEEERKGTEGVTAREYRRGEERSDEGE